MDIKENASLLACLPDAAPRPQENAPSGGLEGEIPQEERRADRLAYMHTLMERFGIQR